MSNATKKVVSNSFYLFLMWFFSTLFGYFFWVVLANFLPKADVGIFSAVLNLALFVIGFSFLGLNSAEIKLIPKYAAEKNRKKIGGTIRWVTKNVMTLNIIIAALVFIFSRQLSSFYLNEAALRTFSVLLVILSTANVMGNHLYSLQKIKLFFLTETAVSLSKLVVAALLVLLGFGWLGAAGGVAASYLAVSILRLKWIPFSGGFDKKEILRYAAPAFFGGIGTILINQGSIVTLSLFTNAAAVGAFTIAFMFTTPIKIIPQIISQAILPITSEEFETNQHMQLRNLVAQSMRYSYLVSIPLTVAFIFFAREFLLLFAKAYVSAAFAFQILALAYLFFGLGSIIMGVLFNAGKPNLSRDIFLLSGIANMVLIFMLVPAFGMEGAGLAFLVSGAILFFVGLWYARKHVGVSAGFGNIIKIVFSSAAFLAILMIFRLVDFSGAAQAVWILISLFFASAAYLISLLFLRFFGGVDVRILEELDKKTPQIFKRFSAFILKTIKKHVE